MWMQLEDGRQLYWNTAEGKAADHTVLFVHGGPGGNCFDFETLLKRKSVLTASGIRWVCYDQYGCGRSPKKKAPYRHAQNIDDLAEICKHLKENHDIRVDALYGHSYGARLVYDTCYAHPDLEALAVLAARGVFPQDALETSILMDLMILRSEQPHEYAQALKIVKTQEWSMTKINETIRQLFQDQKKRIMLRNDFLWAQKEAQAEWESIVATSPVADSDEAYFEICRTLEERLFNPGFFDPQRLKQRMAVFQGYFDFLMNGSCTPCLPGAMCHRFYGSGHFIHFEEPEAVAARLLEILQADK